jgi:hypothetical protein
MIVLPLARLSYQLGTGGNATAWMLSAILGAIAAILLTTWFVHTAACVLAIVRDTGNGCDRIQDWPKLAFVDWFIDGLYLFNSLCVSVLPGIVLNWFLKQCGLTTNTLLPFLMPGCIFFFFPIVLLSLLEKGSLFGIISPPVYQALWVAWRGWMAFYGISFVLLVAVVASVTSMVFVHQFWIVAVPILTLTFAGFIYFRSLGRLAWYSADCTADAIDPAEEQEDFS